MAANRISDVKATTTVEESHDHQHLESSLKPDEVVADAAQKGQAKSGFESLTLWATAKRFKIACLICVCAAFSAGTDGYQLAYDYNSLQFHLLVLYPMFRILW